MNSMASLAFVFPPFGRQDGGMESLDRGDPGTTPKRVRGIQPACGPQDAARVPATHAARDQAIIYLEGDDLQRTFQHLRTAQDQFTVWVRQRTKDLFDGVDLTQIELVLVSIAK